MLLILRKRALPVTGFQAFPWVFLKSGIPEPLGAVSMSRRASFATSGRTGILRVFLVFDEYTRHIIPARLLNVVGRQASQLAERPQAGPNRGEQEVRKHSSVAATVPLRLRR